MAQTDQQALAALLHALEEKISLRFSSIDGHLSSIEGRLGTLEARVGNLEARLANLDATANGIAAKVNTIATLLLAPGEVRSIGGGGCSPAPSAPIPMAASPKR